MNKQQGHHLYSSTGQEDFNNQGESFRISKKMKYKFFIFLKSEYGLWEIPQTFFSFSFPFFLS